MAWMNLLHEQHYILVEYGKHTVTESKCEVFIYVKMLYKTALLTLKYIDWIGQCSPIIKIFAFLVFSISQFQSSYNPVYFQDFLWKPSLD